jgi:transposase
MRNTGNNVKACPSADGAWGERSSVWAGREKKDGCRATERNEEARSTWREQMKQVDASLLVIVDETGSNIGLTPLYAWAPKGQRVSGSVPRNYGKNTTLLASLSLSGMGAAMILEGSTDALAFESYIEQVLAPSLQPGQIVVMDNLSAHTGPKVRQAIAAKGCQLLFLPSYSPDLSPIEEAFSKRKRVLAADRASHPPGLV